MFYKRFATALFAVLFTLSLCNFVYAKEYKIDGLNCTFTLPDTWQVATRSSFNEEFISSQFKTQASDWQSFMERKGFYLLAAVPDDTEGQHEIIIKADRTDEPMDYRDRYLFELKLTAKASYENNPNPSLTYLSYDVVEGMYTKFLVFDYKDSDDSGNPVYGRFYHTVVNDLSVEFDLNAYVPLAEDYLNMFENAVLNTDFGAKTTDSAARLKQNLVFLALAVLAVAFVSVIIIFIVSKVKEKKQFNMAAEEALKAKDAVQVISDGDEDSDDDSDVLDALSEIEEDEEELEFFEDK